MMSQNTYTTLTVKQTRDNLAEILDQVDFTGKQYVVKKFGKLKAMIVPVVQQDVLSEQKRQEQLKKALHAAAGVWADREDMKDPVEYVNNLRKPRYEIDLG